MNAENDIKNIENGDPLDITHFPVIESEFKAVAMAGMSFEKCENRLQCLTRSLNLVAMAGMSFEKCEIFSLHCLSYLNRREMSER